MSIFVAIDDNQSVEANLISNTLFSNIAENVNALLDAMPLGTIAPILVGFTGVPTPNPNIWIPCDGRLITNGNSPMHGQHAPNLTLSNGLYLKGSPDLGQVGQSGGSNFKNLSHAHGGATSVYDPPGNDDQDNDRWEAASHAHGIYADLTTFNFEPAHILLFFYVKVL